MIDLKKVLKENPTCLSSRATFKSILADRYPSEKRSINILTILFECGIAKRIKSKTSLNDQDMLNFLTQVENEYGISPIYAKGCIIIWANALGIPFTSTSNTPPRTPSNKPTPAISSFQTPIAKATVVEGSTSDYETILENGSLKIKKFIGFDKKQITVPNFIKGTAVKIIGEGAFENCTGIETVQISEGITEIHDRAFCGCTALNKIIFPSTLKRLGSHAQRPPHNSIWDLPFAPAPGIFNECAIKQFQLPESLEYIGPNAFKWCRKLSSISLPSQITNIPASCFTGCVELKAVVLPPTLTSIDSFAFSHSGLIRINIPASVTKIEEYAFASCDHLTEVLLNHGTKELGDHTFNDCKSLRSITIPRSVTSIGKEVFDITTWVYPTDRRYKSWSYQSKNNDLIISCYAGSYGLEYARKEGYQYRDASTS